MGASRVGFWKKLCPRHDRDLDAQELAKQRNSQDKTLQTSGQQCQSHRAGKHRLWTIRSRLAGEQSPFRENVFIK
jgi:hypothetical protein